MYEKEQTFSYSCDCLKHGQPQEQGQLMGLNKPPMLSTIMGWDE